MPDAFIYDHVRTPRGRGKVDGALHEVTALNLASQALGAIKDRNDLDPTLVDDVVMGVVDPVGEAGGRYRAHRGARRRLRRQRSRRADQSLLRLRPRRGEFRRRADHVRPAGHGDRRRRRIDEPGRHRRVRRRLGGRSVDRGRALFHAAGHFRRSHRHQIRLFARRRRRLCGGEPEARRDGVGGGPLQPLGHAGEGRQRPHHPGQGRAHAARTRPCSRWPRCSRRSCRWASWAASMRSPIQAHPEVEFVNHVHHAGNSSGIVDGAAAVLVGNKQSRRESRTSSRARASAPSPISAPSRR